jgi:hypothetical protein
MGVIVVCGVVFLGILTGVAAWLIMSDEDGSEDSYWDDLEAARAEYRSDVDDRK